MKQEYVTPLELYVDSREPIEVRRLALQRGFKQVALDFGDFQSEKCVFERKDIGDLVNSIFARYGGSSRLFNQLERMFDYCSKTGKVGFLLITGKIEDVERQFLERGQRLNRFAIYGAIGSVVVRYDFNIIWIEQPVEHWLEIIRKVAEKVEEGKTLLPKRRKLKEYSKSRSVAIVSRALEVSPSVASKLVDKFGNLYGVITALKERPQDVLIMDGIGERTFKKMKEIAFCDRHF